MNGNTRNNRKNNSMGANTVVKEVDETVATNNSGNTFLGSITKAIGLSGGKRNTRKGRKGSCRKNTRKTQAGGKRKMNGYMLFAQEQRKKMAKTSNVVSQAKEIGKRWRALSDAEKARYQK